MKEDVNEQEYPTPFQKKTLWVAISGLSMAVIGAIGVGLIFLVARILQFLQPLLVPLAAAAIIAYLLDPLLQKLLKRGVSRPKAMLTVFLGFLAVLLILMLSVVPASINQGINLLHNRDKITQSAVTWIEARLSDIENKVKPFVPPGSTFVQEPDSQDGAGEEKAGTTEGAEAGTGEPNESAEKMNPGTLPEGHWVKTQIKEWLIEHYPGLLSKGWKYVSSGLQGVFGVFGYVLGLFLIPIYLFYFLKEGPTIKESWSNYLPLQESEFKDEVVDTLNAINGYLINFFRGQMLVSMIDGALIGMCLTLIGLPNGILIGVFVAILGLIPYLGNLLCWLPALFISIAHFGATDQAGKLKNAWSWMPEGAVWPYPLIVTVIFVLVQKVNGLYTAPRIVGNSVGLHPLTVIFSVFFWSMLIGGLLGALLAVPLTAALKVLFQRYVWQRGKHIWEQKHAAESEAVA